MFSFLLIGLLILVCVLFRWRSERQRSFAKALPMLNPAYPLVGNGLLLFGKSDYERFLALRSMTSEQFPFTKFYLGTTLFLGTSDPEVAQQVLTDPSWLDKPFFYEFFQLTYGLLSSKVDIWKVHRKALNPTFNLRILQSFIPIFKQYSQKLVERLATFPEGSTINIVSELMTCSLVTILQTTFGVDGEKFDGYEVLGPKIERFFYLISKRIVTISHYVDFIYQLSADGRENQKLRKYLDEWAAPILDNVARRYSRSDAQLPADDESLKKPKVFVEELHTSKIAKFTRTEIADEAITMVGAGTDTSSNAVAFCLLSLAMHPDVQQKVYEEVMQVYPSLEDAELTLESLKSLLYLEMVIRESLRLFPIAPMIYRQSVADSVVAGLHIPKGNLIAIDIFNMHRRKDVYGEDADVFDPERFSPERSKERNPFAFLAFSGGSRGCIGSRYAMMNIKIMVAHVVKSYVIRTKLRPEDLRFKFDVILRLQNGYLVQLEKRIQT